MLVEFNRAMWTIGGALAGLVVALLMLTVWVSRLERRLQRLGLIDMQDFEQRQGTHKSSKPDDE